MAKRLEANYEIPVRIMDGGGKTEYVPLSDINTYISTEEASDITDITTLLGTTPAQAGSTISADVGTLWTDTETAEGEIDALQAVAPEYKATFDTATAASKILTVAATPGEDESVTIGGVTYHARLDALSEQGVAASAVLTSTNTEVSDGDTVTIGTGANERAYRFKDTPAQAYDVKRDGTTADTTLGNLVKAINASGVGDGSDYYAGTLAHPDVTAGDVAAHAIIFTAKTTGLAGNLIAKSLSAAQLDWDGDGAVFTGGIDAYADGDICVSGSAENFIINMEKAIEASGDNGKDYYLATHEARTDVSVTAKDASTMTVTALTKGAAGKSIDLAETLSHESSKWADDATALSGGVDGQVGATGKIIFTASGIYCCTDGAKCTISDSSGWKTVAFA